MPTHVLQRVTNEPVLGGPLAEGVRTNFVTECDVTSGPKFIRFFWPILVALRDLGGSARAREVIDLVFERLSISDDERSARTSGGNLRVENQIHWARNYLVWAGLLDGSKRGWWQLSPAGWSLPIESQDQTTAFALFKRVREDYAQDWGKGVSDESVEGELPPVAATADEKGDAELATQVRSTVYELSPSGFERLCKRLLTELGLTQLRAVGQAGDRGIDVEGHLRVNPVVSFRVGVQCKKYADGNSITPSQVREFQGALGPFDRGIFMTTSVFTQNAELQADAPGYKPVDLIDGERLVELLIEHKLGIKDVTIVDSDFFDPFR